MEVRISRIVSEYYEYSRKDSEDLIREGRVTLNGEVVSIGEKASVEDEVALDGASIPLKGLFRRFTREAAERETGARFGKHKDEESRYADNPKSRNLRKGRKDEHKKRRGKNYELDL